MGSERYSSYRADTKMFTDGRTDGQTTDGRQAYRYIPRTFRSGMKRDKSFVDLEFSLNIVNVRIVLRILAKVIVNLL